MFSSSDADCVSAAEIEIVSRLISVLTRYKNRMSVVSEVEDDDMLCPICCAYPLTVTFVPCTHQSCKSCITHHLMNSKECFFCKTAITRVTSVDGSVIFEAPATSDSASLRS
ncbi:E3 ubiquitin-protein ligase RNF123-like [Macrosteles quadrilineatus]|uniref:E3 ubiquitin-protein ligase RNF123-like n=1 Tax=Macrosteles quadrilineatus TaxID=74068 RepID=UPI0023E3339B|nr:E3 ubiquitin-protein ligase RNF123-like [Macrosteles quadrilineatus]